MRLESWAVGWPLLPLSLMGGVAAAFWPLFSWYVARLHGGGSEPLGLLSLAVFAAGLWRDRHHLRAPGNWTLILASLGLAAYWVFLQNTFPMVRAGVAIGILALLIGNAKGWHALVALLVLSLPLEATLNFYGSYPLRCFIAEASSWLLGLFGVWVDRDGTTLLWAGERILVDAPCSGLKMLWAGFFFATLLIAWYRLSLRSSVLFWAATGGLLILVNLFRSAGLFFKESRLLPLPDWTHAGFGLLLFAGSAIALLRMAQRLQPKAIDEK